MPKQAAAPVSPTSSPQFSTRKLRLRIVCFSVISPPLFFLSLWWISHFYDRAQTLDTELIRRFHASASASTSGYLVTEKQGAIVRYVALENGKEFVCLFQTREASGGSTNRIELPQLMEGLKEGWIDPTICPQDQDSDVLTYCTTLKYGGLLEVGRLIPRSELKPLVEAAQRRDKARPYRFYPGRDPFFSKAFWVPIAMDISRNHDRKRTQFAIVFCVLFPALGVSIAWSLRKTPQASPGG